jgi:hypothetical protein
MPFLCTVNVPVCPVLYVPVKKCVPSDCRPLLVISVLLFGIFPPVVPFSTLSQ